MAIMSCTECGREISDKALFCPSCGNPSIQQPDILDKEEKELEFREEFGKKWDKYNLWSRIFIGAGFIIGIISQSFILGFSLVLFGFIIAIKFRLYRRSINR